MSDLDERLKFARTLVIGLASAPDDKLYKARAAIESSTELDPSLRRAVLTLIDAILATGSDMQARANLVERFLNAIDELAAQERKKKPCFIATAACGTMQHQDVFVLRRFRDEVLHSRSSGRAFVRAYEFLSPPLARWISVRPVVRRAACWLIVAPARRIADWFLRSESAADRRMR